MVYQPGPFDVPHLYLQWGGKLPGNEQWSCGLRLTPKVGDGVGVSPAMLAAVTSAVTTLHSAAGTHIHPLAKLSFVKLNPIGTDGLYAFDSTEEVAVADVAGGGASTNLYPNQVAIVVSLTTGFSRGPAHRGRFYLPLPSMGIDATGSITVQDAVAVGASVDTFMTALNAADVAYEVSVMSRKLGAPGHRRVTGNEIGRVLDTQRRRRRSLIEDYR